MLLIGKVVDIHPEHNAVDVRLAEDSRKLVGVPVVGLVTGNTGLVDLPVPDLTVPRSEPIKWESLNTKKRDIMAIIGWASESPVCLGFICPPICELNFPPELGEERRIDRHASDVYSWVDKRANAQWCHPNGSYVTLAEDPDKLDLTAKDYDKKWKIRRNLTRVVHFFGALWHDGVETFRAWVKPDGDALVKAAKRLRFEVGDTVVTIDESGIRISSGGAVVTVNPSGLTVTGGKLTATAGADLVGAVRINGITQSGD